MTSTRGDHDMSLRFHSDVGHHGPRSGREFLCCGEMQQDCRDNVCRCVFACLPWGLASTGHACRSHDVFLELSPRILLRMASKLRHGLKGLRANLFGCHGHAAFLKLSPRFLLRMVSKMQHCRHVSNRNCCAETWLVAAGRLSSSSVIGCCQC